MKSTQVESFPKHSHDKTTANKLYNEVEDKLVAPTSQLQRQNARKDAKAIATKSIESIHGTPTKEKAVIPV